MTTKASENAKTEAASSKANLLLLGKLAANRKKREASKEAERQAREALNSQLRSDEDKPTLMHIDGLTTGGAFSDLKALQDKLGLGDTSKEFLESETVLFKPDLEEPSIETDQAFKAAAAEALEAMGMKDSAVSVLFKNEPHDFVETAFRQAVLSGALTATAVKNNECSDAIAAALFSLLAYSSDLHLASAALRALLSMLGQPSINTDTAAWLDSGYSSLATGAADSSKGSTLISDAAVPTAAAILEALQLNGFDPDREAAKEADSGEFDMPSASQAPPEAEGLRIHTIKMLLHLVVAVCRYCNEHPEATAMILKPSDVSELLLAIIHMGLDPAALRLQHDLDAACTALMLALSEADWEKEIGGLAQKVSNLGSNTRSKLRVLRQITGDRPIPRARQLQRLAGCYLVEKILPKQHCAKSTAVPKTGLTSVNPADVLLAQPWFRNAKGVVSGVSAPGTAEKKEKESNAGGGKKSKSKSTAGKENNAINAYTITDVELLIQLCDILLWPSALRAMHDRITSKSTAVGTFGLSSTAEDDVEMTDATDDVDITSFYDDGPPENTFMSVWVSFLTGIHRCIKALQPEDMAVKTLASRLEFKYKEAVDKPTWTGSP